MDEEKKPKRMLVLEGWIEGDPIQGLIPLVLSLKDPVSQELFFSIVGVMPNHIEGVTKALNRLKPIRLSKQEKPLVELAK